MSIFEKNPLRGGKFVTYGDMKATIFYLAPTGVYCKATALVALEGLSGAPSEGFTLTEIQTFCTRNQRVPPKNLAIQMTQLLSYQLVSYDKDKYSYRLTPIGVEFLGTVSKDLVKLNYKDTVSGIIDSEVESLTPKQLACLYVSFRSLNNE